MHVARIGAGDALHQRGIEVAPVRYSCVLDRCDGAGLDQPGKARLVARHHDVVAGVAGEQLGLQRFQAVVDIVIHLDAGFLLESSPQRRGVDVVGPVVNVQHVVLGARAGKANSSRANSRSA